MDPSDTDSIQREQELWSKACEQAQSTMNLDAITQIWTTLPLIQQAQIDIELAHRQVVKAEQRLENFNMELKELGGWDHMVAEHQDLVRQSQELSKLANQKRAETNFRMGNLKSFQDSRLARRTSDAEARYQSRQEEMKRLEGLYQQAYIMQMTVETRLRIVQIQLRRITNHVDQLSPYKLEKLQQNLLARRRMLDSARATHQAHTDKMQVLTRYSALSESLAHLSQ